MPPKHYKTGKAKRNVLSARVSDEVATELSKRLGKKSVSKYIEELIEQDLFGPPCSS